MGDLLSENPDLETTKKLCWLPDLPPRHLLSLPCGLRPDGSAAVVPAPLQRHAKLVSNPHAHAQQEGAGLLCGTEGEKNEDEELRCGAHAGEELLCGTQAPGHVGCLTRLTLQVYAALRHTTVRRWCRRPSILL